ncbi:hypothetical protein ACQKWADRAFT_22020 [Trichoderma austrokoningii]
MDKETNHAHELTRNKRMTLKISVRRATLQVDWPDITSAIIAGCLLLSTAAVLMAVRMHQIQTNARC